MDFVWRTSADISLDLADRLKHIRKRKKITQLKLSEISGVSYASLRRFERTGNISLSSLIKIADALGLVNEIDSLFTQPVYSSIDEVINDVR